MPEQYVTTITLRQTAKTHAVALEHAIDATARLVHSGYNAQLGPTLPAEMVDSAGTASPGFYDEEDQDD